MNQLIKIALFFLFTSSLSNVLFGQYADCNNMLVLTDTFYHAKNVSGYGKKLEFKGNESFEREQNSIWYLITIPADGEFTFDINTNNQDDDWDFLLYEYKPKFCKRIDANYIQPIRSNLSRSSITGLSSAATEKIVKSGLNNNYSKSLVVKEGAQYVILVNNSKSSGGSHTITFHFPAKEKIIPVATAVFKAPTILFQVKIKDSMKKKPLKSHVIISGLKKDIVELSNITSYKEFLEKKNYTLVINAYAKGYMLSSTKFKIRKSKSKQLVGVFLSPIAVGEKVNLNDIQFHGNQATFLPSAKGSLKSLLLFMKENEKIKIEIEGHVNGPGRRNSNEYKELSTLRARAVKAYLIENGIESHRIAKFVGHGNSKMLFPDPKNEKESSANRRVEISIKSIQ